MRGLLKHPRFGPWILALGAFLLRGFLRGLTRTLRFEVVAGREYLAELQKNPRPVLVTMWHNRLVLAAGFVLEEIHGKGLEITVLASQSRDGELISRIAHPWGLHTVRGSATRGGTRAIRALYRTIHRDGNSPVMMPDGPQGPLYQFKMGVVVLSQMSQAPILPLGFAAERFWRIKSWDRIIVPRPFSRVTVTLGAAHSVARGLSSEDLEAERVHRQGILDQLTQEAEAAAGAEDMVRPSTGGVEMC